MLQPLPTRIQVLPPTSLTRLPGEAHECVIAPASASRDVRGLSSASERWSPEALGQYERRRKEAESPTPGAPAEPTRSLKVSFSAGGSSAFVFVEPGATTFDLHAELRRAFEESLCASRDAAPIPLPVRLDVRLLDDVQARAAIRAFAFLSQTAGWKPTAFGKRLGKPGKPASSNGKKAELRLEILSRLDSAQATEIAERALWLGAANNEVRRLADLPANELTPARYRSHIAAFARKHGLQFEFWDTAELARRKAGAFLAVTRADPKAASGIARLTYKPSGGKKSKPTGAPGKNASGPLALIGKGLCFDTGGYNVKTGGSMLGMHGDMTGSAIVLAFMGLLAETDFPHEVQGYLALAENLISPSAYKPNEVVVASDGTSIEVVDTDAEGRMVLSDTLAQARLSKPRLAIDFATLTGAVMRAIDTRRAGVFSNRPELLKAAVDAGDRSGERTWGFPIGADYRRELRSKVADLVQCAPSNHADHIYAATFLSHFIGEETPWVHVDLACSENKGGLGLISSDTTGFGILWADEFVSAVLGS